MKNSYEMAAIIEVGEARQMILGQKFINWLAEDVFLGPGFALWIYDDDIDESDE